MSARDVTHRNDIDAAGKGDLERVIEIRTNNRVTRAEPIIVRSNAHRRTDRHQLHPNFLGMRKCLLFLGCLGN